MALGHSLHSANRHQRVRLDGSGDVAMKRVTLNGINRVGLANLKSREWWSTRRVRIWSAEHRAFWRPGGNGYTAYGASAGDWDFADAYDRTKHCGPEKRIVYYSVCSISSQERNKDTS